MLNIRLGVLAAASLLALTSVASSADMAPVLKAPPPPPPVYSWSGVYIGGHFGGGWARKSWEDQGISNFSGDSACVQNNSDSSVCAFDVVDLRGNVGSHNAIGPLGGVQAGINWQTGRVVFGIEGQYSFANLKGDHGNTVSGSDFRSDGEDDWSVNTTVNDRYSTKVTGIATIAARIGYTSEALDRTLFYVKGGAAYARDKFSVTRKFSSNGCNPDVDSSVECFALNGSGSWSGSQDRWGWMAGIGVEFGLTNNLSAKIEYDYLDFGSKNVTLKGGASGSCSGECEGIDNFSNTFNRNFRINQTIQMVKLGLNYRLDWGSARY